MHPEDTPVLLPLFEGGSPALQTAIAECAKALLGRTRDGAIERAMHSLLAATKASFVFLERNVEHPELGFCSQTVIEVGDRAGGEDDRGDEGEDYWALVPWARMPISRAALERGEPIVVVPSQLTGAEYDLYAEDPYPIKSELDIPIHVDGVWAGLIGFADNTVVRAWSEDDLELLSAAGQLFGAFWEREADTQRLNELVRSKNEFLASISHELRTPLSAIVALSLELVEPDVEEELAKEMAQIIAGQSQEMMHIIEDLLVAGRAETGELSVYPSQIDDIAPMAERVVETLTGISPLRCSVTGNGAAWCDPVRLRQIIRNLLTNAQRYGGPSVEIAIDEGPEITRLVVRDDGDGIEPARREQIFDAYQRTRTHSPQSVGLGLTVSRHLARLMGGDLTYGHKDGWSEFTLTVPRSEGHGSDPPS